MLNFEPHDLVRILNPKGWDALGYFENPKIESTMIIFVGVGIGRTGVKEVLVLVCPKFGRTNLSDWVIVRVVCRGEAMFVDSPKSKNTK